VTSNWRVMSVDQIKAEKEGAIAIGPFGSRMKADQYIPEGVPVIRGNNLGDSSAFVDDFVYVSDNTADSLRSSNVFPDDLVFPHRGAIGRVGIVPSDVHGRYMLSTSMMKLSCNTKLVDPHFVYYFFRSNHGRRALLRRASTVGTPGIGQPLTSLRAITLPVPPLGEQRAIVSVVGGLDEKIDLNRRMNSNLDSLARAIVKEASLAGSAPVVCSDLATVNANTLRGSIPWESIEYVDIGSVWRGQIAEATLVAAEAAPSRARRLAIDGDTAISTVRPDRGAYCLIRDPSANLVLSTGFAVIRPIDRWASPLLYCLLTDPVAMSRYGQVADGGAYPAIRPKVIEEQELAWPNHADGVAREIEQLFSLAAANSRESRTLATLRDALLPKLVSGELRIAQAQGLVEATM
jgi:type I restriction enzyme S subunit